MDIRHSRFAPLIAIAVAGLLLLVILTAANNIFAHQNPGGEKFLAHWLGMRLFFASGLDPYGEEVAVKIQQRAYGHPAGDDQEKLRFVTPFYSALFFLPTLPIKDYFMARAIWMTILELALACQVFLSLRLVGWRPKKVKLWVLILIMFFWVYSLRMLVEGDLVMLVALCITGGLLALREGGDELAGVLFAFATVKILPVILFFIFILFWGIRERRWRMIGWLIMTLALVGVSILLLMPDWLLENLRSVTQFFKDNPVNNLGDILSAILPGTGERIGMIVSAILLLLMLLEWYLARNAEFHNLRWTACLTLVINQWLSVRLDEANGVLLIPALFLVYSLLEERWERAGKFFTYGSMTVLLVGVWILVITQFNNPARQMAWPIVILPAFLLVTLYWVRWWAVRSHRLWFDTIYRQENPEDV